MLKDLSHEEYLIKFNRFPKTKYSLYIANAVYYEFVTTSRSEEDCVDILEKKTNKLNYMSNRYYKIFSEKNGEKKLLRSGKI